MESMGQSMKKYKLPTERLSCREVRTRSSRIPTGASSFDTVTPVRSRIPHGHSDVWETAIWTLVRYARLRGPHQLCLGQDLHVDGQTIFLHPISGQGQD